jgi:hypothetical protein
MLDSFVPLPPEASSLSTLPETESSPGSGSPFEAPPSTESIACTTSMCRNCTHGEDAETIPFYPEITYATNESGDLVQLEDLAWNSFFYNNAARPISNASLRVAFPTIMGKNIFEFICDAKLQRFYRHVMHMVSTGTLSPGLWQHKGVI